MIATAPETRLIPLDVVDADPGQPRKRFERAALEELAASLRSVGLLEPIIVRPTGERFTIIAGERRWRAARLAELEAIPAIVRRDLDETSAFEISMIENVVRADMNPIEEANGYARLLDAGMTIEVIASRLGKTVQDVRFRLGLRRLDGPIADLVAVGQLGIWDAWHISRLSIEGQHRVIRAMNAGELKVAGSLHRLTLAIFEQESQPELFGEAEVDVIPAARVKATRDLRDEIARALAAIERATALVDDATATPETGELVAAAKRAAIRLAAKVDGSAAKTHARQLAIA